MTIAQHLLAIAEALELECQDSRFWDDVTADWLLELAGLINGATCPKDDIGAFRRAAELAAKKSPPTHAAADRPASAPSQEGAGSATAAPVCEPQERVCMWAPCSKGSPLKRAICPHTKLDWCVEYITFCPYCGGRIVEAT